MKTRFSMNDQSFSFLHSLFNFQVHRHAKRFNSNEKRSIVFLSTRSFPNESRKTSRRSSKIRTTDTNDISSSTSSLSLCSTCYLYKPLSSLSVCHPLWRVVLFFFLSFVLSGKIWMTDGKSANIDWSNIDKQNDFSL